MRPGRRCRLSHIRHGRASSPPSSRTSTTASATPQPTTVPRACFRPGRDGQDTHARRPDRTPPRRGHRPSERSGSDLFQQGGRGARRAGLGRAARGGRRHAVGTEHRDASAGAVQHGVQVQSYVALLRLGPVARDQAWHGRCRAHLDRDGYGTAARAGRRQTGWKSSGPTARSARRATKAKTRFHAGSQSKKPALFLPWLQKTRINLATRDLIRIPMRDPEIEQIGFIVELVEVSYLLGFIFLERRFEASDG